MVLDMGEEDDVHLILGRPFLHTTSAITYMRQGQFHFHFLGEKVRCYINSYTTLEKPKKNKNRRCHSQIIKKEEANQERKLLKLKLPQKPRKRNHEKRNRRLRKCGERKRQHH
jgi:hypothetical protein